MTEVEVLDAEIVFDYSCAGEDAEELKQIDRDIQGSWFYIAGNRRSAAGAGGTLSPLITRFRESEHMI